MNDIEDIFEEVAPFLCETEVQRDLFLTALKRAELLGSRNIQDTIQKDKS